ncbi:hypothetical protein CAter282_0870 [Collimonas arenae]|uniref:Uncharacterized protein n=1 Tax=Collimonas arenae TaxID=279058 RepID=A0A127QF34_9BURK|nr:hypothetical protein CAter10_0943 [Collimonas arenae]AMP08670.1 hypothetical protein CAter282_0870 [Collimonas arenae]
MGRKICSPYGYQDGQVEDKEQKNNEKKQTLDIFCNTEEYW